MRKAAILTVLVMVVPGFVHAQDPDTVKSRLEAEASVAAAKLEKDFSVFADSLKAANSKLAKTDSIVRALQTANSDLRQLVSVIASRDSAQASIRRAQFTASQKALQEMSRGVVLITFMQQLVDAEAYMGRVTSFWEDSTFRNTYDRIEDYGTAGAGLLGSLALFQGKNQILKTNEAVGVGAVVMLVSKLIGTLGGEENGRKSFDKMKHIQVSRRAYDDLNIRSKMLSEYIADNKSLKATIDSVLRGFTLRTDTTQAVAQVAGLLQKYESVLQQIPSYIHSIRSAAEVYASVYGFGLDADIESACKLRAQPPKVLGAALCGVFNKASSLDKDYHELVLPVLKVSDDIAKIISAR